MNSKEQEGARDWELIHSYTREQALNDGVLVDAGELAKEAGRLWDILSMLRFAIKKQISNGPACMFQLYVANNDDYPAELITLKAHCGPGDNLEPVLTIMLPGED